MDIFFVISGYLMTSIIMGRLAKGKFSIWEFYNDRAKRIVPGLMGVCFALLVMGYLFVEPATYHYLGSTAISALLFFSNFRFWQATSYFDPQSDTKWFLHTWSLSVEWQFYLAYPLIIMALNKYDKTRRHIVPILWSMAGLSLALCLYYSKVEPPTAFYMLAPRAWELLAGGIVALQFQNSEQKYSNILLYTGLISHPGPIFLYDQYLAWPSYWALLPVLGTCLVIAANRPGAALFKNPLVQTTGKWSYSIYLWHWPVAVTAIYFGFVTTTPLKIASEIVILAMIIGLGGAGYALFRKLTREQLAGEKHGRDCWPAPARLLSRSDFAVTVTANEGLPNRRSEGERQKLKSYSAAASDWAYPDKCNGRDPQGNLQPCQLGPDNGQGFSFWVIPSPCRFFSRFAEKSPSSIRTVPLRFSRRPRVRRSPESGLFDDRFKCNGFVEQALRYAEPGIQAHRACLELVWIILIFQDHYVCFIEGDDCVLSKIPRPGITISRWGACLACARGFLNSRIAAPKSSCGSHAVERLGCAGRTRETEILGRRHAGYRIHRPGCVREALAAPRKSRLISLASSIGAKFRRSSRLSLRLSPLPHGGQRWGALF